MTDQNEKAKLFAGLHVKGEPVIIYNAWDGGSAKAIAAAGAKAIATGDHPVGFAHGFGNDDFDDFTFDTYLVTIKEIAKRIRDLPFSVDINNANGLTGDELTQRIRIVIEAGAIGINYEDRLQESSGAQTIEEQASRIAIIRQAADATGVELFINARTDIFAMADKSEHASLLAEAIERAKAYQTAGASGFFTPGLMDTALIEQLCSEIDLPVNIIRLPGAPSTTELAAAGVSRVSYGPVPQMQMIEWLTQQASTAIKGEI